MGRTKQHTPEQLSAAIDDINEQTDRGAAIIAAGILDEILDVCLQNRMLELSRKRYDALFQPDKPLGSFNAKIELGYALGFYSADGLKTLHGIREVRNKFSHRIEPIKFDHEEVSSSVDALLPPAVDLGRRERFLAAFSMMALMLVSIEMRDIRIKSLGETHPEAMVDLFEFLHPPVAKLLREALRKEHGPDRPE